MSIGSDMCRYTAWAPGPHTYYRYCYHYCYHHYHYHCWVGSALP